MRGRNEVKEEKTLGRHTGSTFDSFLEEEGILEEVEAVAAKRVIACLLEKWPVQAVPSPFSPFTF